LEHEQYHSLGAQHAAPLHIHHYIIVEGPMLSTTFFLLAERAEEATINANRAQMANEEQLNLIMQAMPDVAAIINEERQFVYGNQKLLTFLGFGSVEDLGSLRLGEAVGCKNAFDHEGGCGTGEYCRYCGAAQAMQQAMQKGERVAKECRIST
jgi:PAS domain-containing protein